MSPEESPLISENGIYDLPADVYHADPVAGGSLTATGARKLLPPGSPAKFRWWLDHQDQGRTKEMEFGTVVHTLLLGVGAEPEVVDAPDWRTKAVQEQADQARREGRVPILTADYETAQQMVTRLWEYRYAARLLDQATGVAEQTIVWQDTHTGVWCRSLLDHLHNQPTAGGFFPVVDYKTCQSASPENLPKYIYSMGYHRQIAWQIDAVRAVNRNQGMPVRGYLIFQEKVPPYEVLVGQLDDISLGVGRTRNEDARRLYAQCVSRGEWPGYAGAQSIEAGVWPVDGEPLVRLDMPHWVEWEWRKENDQ